MGRNLTITRRTFHLGSILIGLFGALTGVACGIQAGIEDLGGGLLLPDASLLDRPGRRLASGQFSRLTVDGSLDDGGRVLALRHDGEKAPALAIIPFLKSDGEQCEIGNIVGFDRLSSRIDLQLPPLIAVQMTQDESGRGEIRFVDFQCEERMPRLENATLPRTSFPEVQPRGLLALNAERDLYFVDVSERKLELIFDRVTQARVMSGKLWILREGQLIVMDSKLKEIARLGEAVSSFAIAGGSDLDVVFQDGDQVITWSEKGETRTVASDACAPGVLATGIIAYYSPCADRKIWLELPAAALGVEGSSGPENTETSGRLLIEGPQENLTAYPPRLNLSYGSEPSELLFVTSPDPAAIRGSIVSASVPKSPKVEAGEPLKLTTELVVEDAALVSGDIYVGWDRTVGDLYVLARDSKNRISGVTFVAERVRPNPGVSAFANRGVLLDFDSATQTGEFSLIQDEGDETVIERLVPGVPVQAFVYESKTGNAAFVANYSAPFGDVFLVESGKPDSVASNAYIDTLRFLDQPRAVTYLSRSRLAEGTELHAYLIEAGLDLLIADGVNEYRGLPWPSPGVLYGVWSGENAGIWLSKAR